MIGYTNVGALDENGKRFQTKKALKEAIAQSKKVIFDGTSLFDSGRTFIISDSNLTTLSVVGPDPYNDRKWYATIKNGKVS
jgi:hypothetical protein